MEVIFTPPKPTGALGLLEQLLVDLAAEDLVHAAHEAAAGLLVVVQVEELAARGDAAGRVDHAGHRTSSTACTHAAPRQRVLGQVAPASAERESP